MPLKRPTWERFAEEGNLCSFGLVSAPLAAFLATDIGLGATAGGIAAGGLTSAALGAGLGAGLAGIEGKPLGPGALFGGLTGGAIGAAGPALGGAIEGATGLSSGVANTVGDVAIGAGTGALAGPLTGQSPLSGAIGGGIAGVGAGALGVTGSGATSGPTTGAAAISPSAGSPAGASGAAAPGAVALPAGGSGATPVDLSTSFSPFGTGIPGDVGANAAAGAGLSQTGDPNALFGGAAPLGGDTAAATTAGVTGAAAGGAGSTLSNMFGYLSNNPGLLLGAGALGADLLMGNQPLPAQAQVQSASADQASVGRTLSAYGLSGTLPSGLQDVVNQNTNAGVAAVKSKYAQLGLSGSTMEAQAVQQIHESAAAQTSQMANQLLSQGAQWTGMSNQELNTLLQTQMQQDAALTGAIGTFAGALAGSSLRNPSQGT